MNYVTKDTLMDFNYESLMRGNPNGKTYAGQVKEILNQVKRNNGFSIFWVTENNKRASVATDIVNAGVIEPVASEYPWCGWRIKQNGVRDDE